ncbi:MAG: rRNA maturation RNase YbeY [Candidatus Saganbacteria bacterium]|nr:rRNA maturation RNase YbeY [Candidatus Saganbacteria bacterium]
MKNITKKFVGTINKILKAKGKLNQAGKIEVYFINDRFMRKLNKEFRGIDRTTDVLAFPDNDNELLGEIVISDSLAKVQAKRYRVLLKEEYRRLVIHGVLHLLGYGHKNKKERSLMRNLEEKYLK